MINRMVEEEATRKLAAHNFMNGHETIMWHWKVRVCNAYSILCKMIFMWKIDFFTFTLVNSFLSVISKNSLTGRSPDH